MRRQDDYYILDKEAITIRQRMLSYLLIPFLALRWFASFLISRNLSSIILNPDGIKRQKEFHLIKTSEDQADDIVVVNLINHSTHKWFRDFLLKFSNTVMPLAFSSSLRKPSIDIDRSEDKAHVDEMLSKIDSLVSGTFEIAEGNTRQFAWEKIHFKGLEFFTPKARAYFYTELTRKYGDMSITLPRAENFTFYSLQTPDGAVLDSVEVIGAGEKEKKYDTRKYVITCLARDQNYIDWLKDMNLSANQIKATVIGFNYRGVDYSKGMVWTQDNMINDIIAQVKRLLDLGVNPENIGLEGMCVGGAVATLAAARLHEMGIKVKLYNERSFRSILKFVVGFILPPPHSSYWNPLTYLRYFAAAIIYVLIAPILWLSGWHMNAASAWDKIPAAYKDYSIVRNAALQETDGVISDHNASLGSLVDEKHLAVNKKFKTGKVLSPEELMILGDKPSSHHFKKDSVENLPERLRQKMAHHFPRKYLVRSDSRFHPLTMHEHMQHSFRDQGSDTYDPSIKRPLVIACSGGAGHISAALGIIDDLKSKHPDNLHLTSHEAHLYRNSKINLQHILIRIGLFLMSLAVIGTAIRYIVRKFGYPALPESKVFWREIANLERNESDANLNNMARQRPYIDMLLDIYPTGYQFAAINNALHLTSSPKDIEILLQHKSSKEESNYEIAYVRVMQMLIEAAERGEPYTEIVSTQALSLRAMCDAVINYNKYYLPSVEKNQGRTLPKVSIHQYMTDLPSLESGHFLDELVNFNEEQRRQLHLYAVNLTPAIIKGYFGDSQFKSINNLPPNQNPMVRSGFKDASLAQYLDSSKECTLQIRVYDNKGALIPNQDKITIPSEAKVASIMIGSLAAIASVDYVKHLLNKGYDRIFVFGGLNAALSQELEKIILSFDEKEQPDIRKRIICLGNQTDAEIAPIMTRSDCVVIRGGGLSVMEQMALPIKPGKKLFIHHNDSLLKSGTPWEDSNADCLMEHYGKYKFFAKKTYPNGFVEELERADKFYVPFKGPKRTISLPPARTGVNQTSKLVRSSSVHSFFHQRKSTSAEDALIPDLLPTKTYSPMAT
ncbi:protein SdbA [Legionella impletisoli]|uniref:Protein SdbA n=1 Tax=Legionella impletisoli TaxID=343510 RepID=A0A917JM69_9GAMM|nr:protein SdbA [Legionella impletisoli]GGI77070.1 protein SdbA [Legionella impletisoli]